MATRKRNGIGLAITAWIILSTTAVALATETLVPPSTNPANHAIFPAKGQDADQKMRDQLAAYNWATQQTGWDPYKAHAKLVEQGHAAEQTAEQAKGGLVGGGARGALVGVAVGAIAGDAGKGAAIGAAAGGLTGGMRSRRTQRGAEATKEQAIEAFNGQFPGSEVDSNEHRIKN